MVSKRLALLASSRKFGKRCDAGREKLADRLGASIRLVSTGTNGEVDHISRQHAPGVDPEMMDRHDAARETADPSVTDLAFGPLLVALHGPNNIVRKGVSGFSSSIHTGSRLLSAGG
jgi:hypothetical protein